jgi:hypothetical protein
MPPPIPAARRTALPRAGLSSPRMALTLLRPHPRTSAEQRVAEIINLTGGAVTHIVCDQTAQVNTGWYQVTSLFP